MGVVVLGKEAHRRGGFGMEGPTDRAVVVWVEACVQGQSRLRIDVLWWLHADPGRAGVCLMRACLCEEGVCARPPRQRWVSTEADLWWYGMTARRL